MKKIYVNETKTAQIVLESDDGLNWYVKNMPATGLPCAVEESDEPLMVMQINGFVLAQFPMNGEVFKIADM